MKKRQQRLPWLTVKEDRLVRLYVGEALGNGTVAARLAGYRGSPASLAVIASRVLRKVNVAAEIDELMVAVKERLQVDGDAALMVVANTMKFNVKDLFDAEGKLIPVWKLPRHISAAIKGMRATKHGTVLEFRDTVHAAEILLKVSGRLKETVKVERPLEEIMAQANQLQQEQNATAESAAASEPSRDERRDRTLEDRGGK